MIKINIANDFTDTPGGRHKTEGSYSGEEFRERILEPAYEHALKNGEKIVVDFDGSYGYPTSFLEEVFGGLARRHKSIDIDSTFEFISNDEPSLIDDVKDYIRFANGGKS